MNISGDFFGDRDLRRVVDSAVTDHLNTLGAQRGLAPVVWNIRSLNVKHPTVVGLVPDIGYDNDERRVVAEQWAAALDLVGTPDPFTGSQGWRGTVAGWIVLLWYVRDPQVWENAVSHWDRGVR